MTQVWLKVNGLPLKVSVPESGHMLDAVDGLLNKYNKEMEQRTLFDVASCSQGDHKLTLQTALSELEDTMESPVVITFKEGTGRPVRSTLVSPKPAVKSTEIERILTVAREHNIAIDEVCAKFDPDDVIFIKSGERGYCEPERAALKNSIKTNFCDSELDETKCSVSDKPYDLKNTYSITAPLDLLPRFTCCVFIGWTKRPLSTRLS